MTSDQPWSKHTPSIPNRTRRGTINDARSKDSAAQMSEKHKQTFLVFFLDWKVYDGVSELCKQLSLVLKRPTFSLAQLALNTFFLSIFSISIRRKHPWMFGWLVALKWKKKAPMPLALKRIGRAWPKQDVRLCLCLFARGQVEEILPLCASRF